MVWRKTWWRGGELSGVRKKGGGEGRKWKRPAYIYAEQDTLICSLISWGSVNLRGENSSKELKAIPKFLKLRYDSCALLKLLYVKSWSFSLKPFRNWKSYIVRAEKIFSSLPPSPPIPVSFSIIFFPPLLRRLFVLPSLFFP